MNKLKTEYLFFRQQEHNMKVLLINTSVNFYRKIKS